MLVTVFLFVWLLSGCDRPVDSKREVQETRIRIALKDVFVNGRIAATTLGDVRDIVNLKKAPDVHEQILALASFGQSNVFFNPDLNLWASTNTQSSREFAVILNDFKGHYLGVLFDGDTVETNVWPAKWIQ